MVFSGISWAKYLIIPLLALWYRSLREGSRGRFGPWRKRPLQPPMGWRRSLWKDRALCSQPLGPRELRLSLQTATRCQIHPTLWEWSPGACQVLLRELGCPLHREPPIICIELTKLEDNTALSHSNNRYRSEICVSMRQFSSPKWSGRLSWSGDGEWASAMLYLIDCCDYICQCSDCWKHGLINGDSVVQELQHRNCVILSDKYSVAHWSKRYEYLSTRRKMLMDFPTYFKREETIRKIQSTVT